MKVGLGWLQKKGRVGLAWSHPAPLLYKPGVKLLPDDLENPSDHHPDVLQVVGGQRLESRNQSVHLRGLTRY